LRRSESGEADRRLTLLTKEFGKIDVIAKGARKGGSRLAGASEPLVLGEYHWAEGRGNRRFLTQVQPETSWPKIRRDYDLIAASLAAAELVAEAMPYASPDEEHFETFVLLMTAIGETGKWEAALAWFGARLLSIEGRGPDWMMCMSTGDRVDEQPAWVSPKAGGCIASLEAGKYSDAFCVPRESLIALQKLAERETPPENLKFAYECLKILHRFWQAEVDRPLPAFGTVVKEFSRPE
jgi:DNA repair protein RecO (recombination protein O)